MNLREPDTIADQIEQLQLDLIELKAKQFTGQDSGMLFRETTGDSANIQTEANAYSCYWVNVTFTPDEDKTPICFSSFEITADGRTVVEKKYPYSDYIRLLDVGTAWEFTFYNLFHEVPSSGRSITWQSLLYVDGHEAAVNFHFKPIIRASDSGKVSVSTGRYY